MSTRVQYQHLDPRLGSNYRQLWVKGRHRRAAVLYRLTVGSEPRTPEEVAQDYDLPVEAVHEAIDYATHHQESLEAERAREQANTYITLVFRDTVTGEPLSMGVCIAARADRDGHEVIGRYLLPGAELHMSDHLESVDGERGPREWAVFQSELRRRSRDAQEEVVYPNAERFVKAMLYSLRGTAGAANART